MSNNTIIKTFKILDLISKSSEHLTGAEIAKELGIPNSTTHDILKTLLEENVIYYKDFNRKTYAMGVRIFSLSKGYLLDSNIINISASFIKKICDKYGITGYVLKPTVDSMLITYKYESSNSIVKSPDTGYEFKREIHKLFGVYFEDTDIHNDVSIAVVPVFDYTNKAIGEILFIGLKTTMKQDRENIETDILSEIGLISERLGSY